MFNPKQNNLLDEQMMASGLEMNIDPFTAITAGIGLVKGVSSIAGGPVKQSPIKCI